MAAASDWKPELTRSETFNNRPTDWYSHSAKADWGCQNPQQKDTFIVVHPKTGDAAGRPLYVVLHSAGHNVQTCLDCTKTPGNHDIYHAPADFYALFVDCAANRGTDWWWGADKQTAPGKLTPVELRVIDTVLWTIQKYGCDPNRVYLCGNSMGGSGTLGLGLRHGGIFAAIKANVPARIEHAWDRMYFESGIPADVTLPDPPICIDYSGTNDGWSNGHDRFYKAMHDRKYAVLGFWGMYGHANNNAAMAQFNDIIHAFDWTSVRKNAAYPVFTDASTDNVIPWPSRTDSKPGQINAFFRWNNVSDSANQVQVELYLVSKDSMSSKFFEIPQTATANVSLRRIQNLNVKPGDTFRWSFGNRKGTVLADPTGLITINGLTITATPTVLTIEK